jgi:hypothetical protein
MSVAKCPACTSDPRRAHTAEELKDFHPKAFLIRGADGEKIPVDDFYFNSKARCRRIWLDPLPSVARQIYARLESATMGYKQELAVKTVKLSDGSITQVSLKPSDVIRDCKISPRDFRRGMSDLERAGLAERRAIDGSSIRKGQIELYSWYEPRSDDRTEGEKKRRAHASIPDWFPSVEEAPALRSSENVRESSSRPHLRLRAPSFLNGFWRYRAASKMAKKRRSRY